MKYRADIDGLRALAVVPVLLFHADVAPFGGGFVGVDVFFVISGYLITAIVRDEIDAGRFSLAGFYQRRVLRIFPALFAVLAATSVAAGLVLMPAAFRDFGQSLLATTTFWSNVLFWRESGYFDGAADLKPLLHTWSLSVEEQFYLLMPLSMLLISRHASRRYAGWLSAFAAASLGLSVVGVRIEPTATFYLMPSRAWELLMGSLLAVHAIPKVRAGALCKALAVAGVLLILASVVLFRKGMPFPGAAALVPCVGAALLIHTGADCPTTVHRLLRLRPIVLVGAMSYSLYLWHWPVVVFTRILQPSFGVAEKVLVVGSSLVLAFLSWKYIEQPFRTTRARARAWRTLGVAGAAMVGATSLGLAIHFAAGFPGRFGISRDELDLMADHGVRAREFVRRNKCFTTQAEFPASCLGRSPRVLILGDSHGDHLLPGLVHAFPGVHFVSLTAGGCRPLRGLDTRPETPACAALNEFRFSAALDNSGFAIIALAAAWRSSDNAALEDTIRFLKERNLNVMVFGPIVEYRETVPLLLRTKGEPLDEFRSNDPRAIDQSLRAVTERASVPFASVYQQICGSGSCRGRIGDEPLQWDDEHLTIHGSEWVIDGLLRRGELEPLRVLNERAELSQETKAGADEG